MKKHKEITSKGFSLLEVMVAIAILSMITVMLWGAFNQSLSIRESIVETDSQLQMTRIMISKLRADLGSAYIKTAKDNPNIKFIGEDHGDDDRLEFASFTHFRYLKNSRESDEARLDYFLEDSKDEQGTKQLKRRENKIIDDTSENEGGVSYSLAENVVKLNFRYCDGIKAEWKDSWDSTNPDYFERMPMAVELTVDFKKGDEEKQTLKTIFIVDTEFNETERQNIVMKGCPIEK